MGSSLDRWYHRTVLVIWPSSSNYNMLYSGDEGFTQALKDLQGITSHEGSNNDEIELIDFVLSKADKDPAAVAQAVTRVALQWNDAPLWNNTVKTCCVHKGLAILSEDRIRSAVDHFGLEAVKSGLEDMLANDPHNAPRLEFLRHLEEWAAAMPDGAPQKSAVQQWATENTLKVLKTLRKPQSAEKQLLISIANANGGIDYLKDQ
ncbi:hypothetical protein BDY19DRAFT_135115 [Irpex rosettiformis]|uniref:Uncharacterized protein n=1 Tax=Irpex rosettiformis TaxID=378272 RepID=A0ACB8U4K3_9APHY|nr:hypothetical protein BDY19DRAFT_135115 [Irpex rosettiformis]